MNIYTDAMITRVHTVIDENIHSVIRPNDVSQNIYSVLMLKNFIKANIFKESVHVLIDSGADVCADDSRVTDKYQPKTKACIIELSDQQNLHTADNTNMSITLMAKIPIVINGHKSAVKFYIVNNLHVVFILGLDWLKDICAQIDFKNDTLQICKRKLLFSNDAVTIPPFSEHVLIVRIRGDELPRGITGVPFGLKNHNSNILFGKSLVVIQDNKIRVRCLNTTNKEIEIKRNVRSI